MKYDKNLLIQSLKHNLIAFAEVNPEIQRLTFQVLPNVCNKDPFLFQLS